MSPVGGPRHFDGSGLGTITGWKCPACGADNAGPLEAGCQLCGSGRPGTHVGQAPPAAAEGPAVVQPDPRIRAYEDWILSPEIMQLLSEVTNGIVHGDTNPLPAFVGKVFLAGWDAGQRDRTMHTHSEPAEPKTLPGLPVALPFPVEGKVARTLIAALRAFIDTLFMEATDEIDSGEWCSVEEAKALIAQLEAHTNG